MNKRFLLFSDTHGRNAVVEHVLKTYGPFDGAFFCGDGHGLENELMNMPGCPPELHMVSGNCDWHSTLPDEAVFTLGTHRVFLTHGDRFRLRRDLTFLSAAARDRQCDLCFFGHIHMPRREYCDGVLMVNPGSLSEPRQEPAFPTCIIVTLDDHGDPSFELCTIK